MLLGRCGEAWLRNTQIRAFNGAAAGHKRRPLIARVAGMCAASANPARLPRGLAFLAAQATKLAC